MWGREFTGRSQSITSHPSCIYGLLFTQYGVSDRVLQVWRGLEEGHNARGQGAWRSTGKVATMDILSLLLLISNVPVYARHS